jgi:hypothetical protein
LTYLLIIVAVAFVLMPVFWLMPSPAQKRQARLRQQAMSLGLIVKVCNMPQSRTAVVRKEEAVKGVLYRLPINGRDGAKVKASLLQRVDQDTEASGNEDVKEVLDQTLQTLPASVQAVECNATSVGAYWREQGDEAAVDQIHQALLALRQQLINKS